jgi:hypothetical protein
VGNAKRCPQPQPVSSSETMSMNRTLEISPA